MAMLTAGGFVPTTEYYCHHCGTTDFGNKGTWVPMCDGCKKFHLCCQVCSFRECMECRGVKIVKPVKPFDLKFSKTFTGEK